MRHNGRDLLSQRRWAGGTMMSDGLLVPNHYSPPNDSFTAVFAPLFGPRPLQTVLSEIAVVAKNGPYKGMWSLKKECRTGPQLAQDEQMEDAAA